MRLTTGQGLHVFVPHWAIIGIANYRKGNEMPMPNMCEVLLSTGDRLLCEGSAEKVDRDMWNSIRE